MKHNFKGYRHGNECKPYKCNATLTISFPTNQVSLTTEQYPAKHKQ